MKKIQRQLRVVGDAAAQRRADGRREHDRHAVDGERHAALLRREGVGQDRLLAGRSPPPPSSLQDAEEDQQRQVGARPHRNELTVKSATQVM